MTCQFNIMRVAGAIGLLASTSVAQQWSAPKPGWLYVLDVGGAEKGGNIFLVDPREGEIKGALSTAYHPNFGLSPDGSRLYVIDGPQSSGNLSTFDTQSGKLVSKVPIPDRVVYTVRPSGAGVGFSADGRWLFVQRMVTISPGLDEHSLSIVDARSGKLFSESVQLPGCGMARFINWPFGKWDIAAQCSHTNSIRFVSMGDGASRPKVKDVSLTWARQEAADGSFVANGQRVTTSTVMDTGRNMVLIMRGGGGVDQLDAQTLAIEHLAADNWQTWQPPGAVAFSPSAGLVYVGSMAYSQLLLSSGLMRSISVRRTNDWTEVANVRTSLPFSTLALQKDGKILYTANTGAGSITVIDAAALAETKTIGGLGRPSLILIQP